MMKLINSFRDELLAGRNRPFMHAWIVLFIFALGFTAGQVRTLSVAAPVLHKKTAPLAVEGRVRLKKNGATV